MNTPLDSSFIFNMLFISILFFMQSSNIIFPKTSSPNAANNLVWTFNKDRLHKLPCDFGHGAVFKLSTKPKGFADRGDAAQCAHSRRKTLAHFWAEKCFFRGACPRKKRIGLIFRLPRRKTLRGFCFNRVCLQSVNRPVTSVTGRFFVGFSRSSGKAAAAETTD